MKRHSAYKDSGVEWLGQIPEHWELRKFKFLFKEINEKSPGIEENLLSVSHYTGVTKRIESIAEGELVTSSDTLSEYKKVSKNDLVSNIMLAWNGSLGFSPYDGITSPSYAVYRLNQGNHEKFFHYLVRSQLYKSEFKRKSTGIIESRLRLYTDDFYSILSLLPPLSEQLAIANFLDLKTSQIDSAIVQKEQMIALLKERKQIIIQNSVTKGLNPNAKMKDSGVEWLGQIPKHWEIKKLKYLFKAKTGFAFPSTFFSLPDTDGIPVVRIGDLDINGIVVLDNCPRLPNSFAPYIDFYGLKESDILFAMTGGTIGKAAKYNSNKIALLNQRVCALTIENKTLNKLIWHWFNTVIWKEHIDVNSSGGAQPNISETAALELKIAYPPLREQTAIVAYIDSQSTIIEKAVFLKKQQIEKLKELKATIIDSAVTGKIKIEHDK